MVSVAVDALHAYVTDLLHAKGTLVHIAATVDDSLVLSNQRSHDSHAFIRVAPYCHWIDRAGSTPLPSRSAWSTRRTWYR